MIYVCRKISKIGHIMAFFDIHISHLKPIFWLLSIISNLNKWYNMIKTHLSNICSQIFEFYTDWHFYPCFFSSNLAVYVICGSPLVENWESFLFDSNSSDVRLSNFNFFMRSVTDFEVILSDSILDKWRHFIGWWKSWRKEWKAGSEFDWWLSFFYSPPHRRPSSTLLPTLVLPIF